MTQTSTLIGEIPFPGSADPAAALRPGGGYPPKQFHADPPSADGGIRHVRIRRLPRRVRRDLPQPVEDGRAAADGDQVKIDFVGSIDGEAFDGGAAEDFVLQLGSGQFIPGFEEQPLIPDTLELFLNDFGTLAWKGTEIDDMNLRDYVEHLLDDEEPLESDLDAAEDFLTRALALELAPLRIRVNAIAPGFIDAHLHPVYADRIDTLSRAAVCEGVTTLIPYIGAVKAGTARDEEDPLVYFRGGFV